ncbi:MAG TPA: phosphoenolpyruvate carboxykinase, partial [Thermoplasmataceae archaeon]|nr:phosphoenolpyruvate carboxykinase [Thermoplasmataceae archaeon]
MERINLTEAEEWIESVADILEPDDIHICDGSDDEYQRLVSLLIEHEELIKLNPKSYPNCYLYRSDPKDVARTEKATYICAKSKDAVGPLNNFLHVDEARDKVMPILKGALAGKTMYVVPYIMGPADSPYSDVGIEITDSEYVVLNMKIMTRMGKIALERIE